MLKAIYAHMHDFEREGQTLDDQRKRLMKEEKKGETKEKKK